MMKQHNLRAEKRLITRVRNPLSEHMHNDYYNLLLDTTPTERLARVVLLQVLRMVL